MFKFMAYMKVCDTNVAECKCECKQMHENVNVIDEVSDIWSSAVNFEHDLKEQERTHPPTPQE